MNAASSIAQTGLQAVQRRMGSTAHNLANAQTENFRREEVTQETVAGGGTRASTRRAAVPGEAMAKDLVDQKSAGYAFDANLKVIQTEKKMMGRLLDEKA
jgi:flagellar basal body rod protein FlgC